MTLGRCPLSIFCSLGTPPRQGHNLALIVLRVPSSLDSGRRTIEQEKEHPRMLACQEQVATFLLPSEQRTTYILSCFLLAYI